MKLVFYFLAIIVFISSCTPGEDTPQQKSELSEARLFAFTKVVTLPGGPVEIYNAISGDISGWWDHSFSENPLKFYIEAKPGGGFYEIFNEQGDGILHATVTGAHRGKMLRFNGPLGLAGRALNMETTYTFDPIGADSTRLTVDVHGSGEVDGKTVKIVEQVWEHFIFERFEPYILEGRHN